MSHVEFISHSFPFPDSPSCTSRAGTQHAIKDERRSLDRAVVAGVNARPTLRELPRSTSQVEGARAYTPLAPSAFDGIIF